MPEVGLLIEGSGGTVRVNDDKVILELNNGKVDTWYRHDLQDNVPFWLGGPEYYREDDYFIRSVKSKFAAEPSFDTASKVDAIIDQIIQRT